MNLETIALQQSPCGLYTATARLSKTIGTVTQEHAADVISHPHETAYDAIDELISILRAIDVTGVRPAHKEPIR